MGRLSLILLVLLTCLFSSGCEWGDGDKYSTYLDSCEKTVQDGTYQTIITIRVSGRDGMNESKQSKAPAINCEDALKSVD